MSLELYEAVPQITINHVCFVMCSNGSLGDSCTALSGVITVVVDPT